MESRKRHASASTSTYSEDQSKSHARRGSHSATPAELDEDGNARRSTRGRNPLPPTTGPLFPPLPPKIPKSRSTSALNAAASSSDANAVPTSATDNTSNQSGTGLADDELSGLSSPGESKKDLPSGSINSLTPPPPTSEDANLDMDIDDPPADEAEATTPVASESRMEGTEDPGAWDAYHRQRAVRGFGQTSEVKTEPQDVPEDNDETPRKGTNGNGHAKTESVGKWTESVAPESPPPTARMDSGGRLGRKRRGEDQLLLDDHLLPAEMRRGAAAGKKSVDEKVHVESEAPADEEEEEDGEEEQEDKVRCVCKTEDPEIMMIQCDECSVWQHGPCMGIWNDDEAPDEYYCEECRPNLHLALKRYLRSKGKMLANAYITPTPSEIRKLHPSTDKNNPSQSTRWTDPAYQDPPIPAKPPVRSHHRKEVANAVDVSKSGNKDKAGQHPGSRKVPSGRDQSSTSGQPHGPPSSGKQDTKRKGPHESTVKRTLSVNSPSPSHSPPPHGQHPSAKRRSTMNSRDAAYELEMKAALDASRNDAPPSEAIEEEALADADVSEAEGEEKMPARKGKRKREDDEGHEAGSDATLGPQANGKAKHPNQYTYRPKPVSQIQATASPMRRVATGSTPAPSLPPPAQHEHGTRRAGAIASGIIPPPPNTISVHNLHWHLPDHLAAFSDILPGPDPIPLEARTSRTMATLSRNHFINQKYGPFTEERDEKGNLLLPEEPSPREVLGDPNTQLEPPTRVRYPARRITTADVRKRIRNMMDYVNRAQQEESRRKERAGLIGIDLNRLPTAVHLDKDGNEQNSDAERLLATTFGQGQTSAEMMDELMKDLINFQENFAGMATAGNNFGVSPLPPTSAMFSSSMPPTPTVPDTTMMSARRSSHGEIAHTLEVVDAVLEDVQAGARDTAETAVEEELDKSATGPDDAADDARDKEPIDAELPVEEALEDPGTAMDIDPPDHGVPVEPQSNLDSGQGESLSASAPQVAVTTGDPNPEVSSEKTEVPQLAVDTQAPDATAQSTIAEAEEAVDVYRAGKVDEVITRPEEVKVAAPPSGSDAIAV